LKFLASKFRSANGALSKMRYYLPREILNTIYHALFNSHILYNTDMGQSLSNNNRIHKLQKSAARLLTFSDWNSHSEPLFEQLKLQTINEILFQ